MPRWLTCLAPRRAPLVLICATGAALTGAAVVPAILAGRRFPPEQALFAVPFLAICGAAFGLLLEGCRD